MELEELITLYNSAWSEPDRALRQQLLDRVWAEDGTYTDPTAHVAGRAELVAHIGEFFEQFPGAQIVPTSAVDAHHPTFALPGAWCLRMGRCLWRALTSVSCPPMVSCSVSSASLGRFQPSHRPRPNKQLHRSDNRRRSRQLLLRCSWGVLRTNEEVSDSMLMYIEVKTGHGDSDPAWIAQVKLSKSGRTVYFGDKALKRIGGSGVSGNHIDIETGDEYWVSGVKKDGLDRH